MIALGIIGLILIICGMLQCEDDTQSWLYVFGGMFMFAYSILVWDVIFIVLQSVFTLAALLRLFGVRIGRRHD